jgi:hypothetical protein
MKNIKFILISLLILCLALAILTFLKIKAKEDFQQKAVLAMETRKVLEHLMVDLREARENTILDAPADGAWHSRIGQGSLEYIVKEGRLLRLNHGQSLLIADDIATLHIRRQQSTPDILEVQIEAQKNVSLVSNLRIRIRH